jgi:hypothetical protein
MLDRRGLLSAATAFCVYALLPEVRAAGAPAPRGVDVRAWITRQDELARGLAAGTVSALEWHAAVNALAREVDLEALAAELRRADARSAGAPFGHDPQKRFIRFRDEHGAPRSLGYGVALFDFVADSVITPHAHRHMASAHLVLDGRIRVRTFDRLGDEDGALLIRPTGDHLAGPGHSAAMTSARDNVHWFAARSPRAMTLDVIVDGLDPGAERYLIQPLDPLAGEQLADGSIRAPLLSFERSMELYDAAI